MMYGWIIIVILIAFWYFGRGGFNITSKLQETTPLEILKKRFANGEITKNEFEEQKKVVDGGN